MSSTAQEQLATSDFVAKMEEFGFLSYIESELPPEFTVVYEIARILENSSHPLSQMLAPVIEDAHHTASADAAPAPTPVPLQFETVEYEAHLLRHTHEISRIYPQQFLLPDDIFYKRLVNRSLWLPREVPPNNFRYRSDSDTFSPDSRKQKVYLLLDTSSSMALRYRIHLLKAVAYIFLKRNMHELGTVFLRAFDVDVHELHIANDEASFHRLLLQVMNISSLGNGTVLWKALQTAVRDIRALDDLHEAEILIITDGAVHLEIDKVKALLKDDITLHTIKIGDEEIQPHPNFFKDAILARKDRRSIQVQKLYEKERDVEFRLRSVGGEHLRVALERELNTIREHIVQHTRVLADEIAATYGREIIELSTVYVQVPDIDAAQLFAINPDQARHLAELSRHMVANLEEFATAEAVKLSALLLNHLQFLQKFNPDNDDIKESVRHLDNALDTYIDEAADVERDAHTAHFSIMEQKQIHTLMKSVSTGKKVPLSRLFRYLLAKVRRFAKLTLQRLRYRNLRAAGKRIMQTVSLRRNKNDNSNDVFS